MPQRNSACTGQTPPLSQKPAGLEEQLSWHDSLERTSWSAAATYVPSTWPRNDAIDDVEYMCWGSTSLDDDGVWEGHISSGSTVLPEVLRAAAGGTSSGDISNSTAASRRTADVPAILVNALDALTALVSRQKSGTSQGNNGGRPLGRHSLDVLLDEAASPGSSFAGWWVCPTSEPVAWWAGSASDLPVVHEDLDQAVRC